MVGGLVAGYVGVPTNGGCGDCDTTAGPTSGVSSTGEASGAGPGVVAFAGVTGGVAVAGGSTEPAVLVLTGGLAVGSVSVTCDSLPHATMIAAPTTTVTTTAQQLNSFSPQ
ncbi:MAG: hypothetical protein F4X65_07905 [Chloroflexi bacterium]|nr:hypothetical protein [Chloroflexota bacterium]